MAIMNVPGAGMIDTVSLNKVKGKPFTVGELVEKMEQLM